jgi:hypothetical protein
MGNGFGTAPVDAQPVDMIAGNTRVNVQPTNPATRFRTDLWTAERRIDDLRISSEDTGSVSRVAQFR